MRQNSSFQCYLKKSVVGSKLKAQFDRVCFRTLIGKIIFFFQVRIWTEVKNTQLSLLPLYLCNGLFSRTIIQSEKQNFRRTMKNLLEIFEHLENNDVQYFFDKNRFRAAGLCTRHHTLQLSVSTEFRVAALVESRDTAEVQIKLFKVQISTTSSKS